MTDAVTLQSSLPLGAAGGEAPEDEEKRPSEAGGWSRPLVGGLNANFRGSPQAALPKQVGGLAALRAAAAAAALEEDDDDDDEDEDEGGDAEEAAPAAAADVEDTQRELAEETVGKSDHGSEVKSDDHCHGSGTWAIGPEALHGGPKLGKGFAQSTGGGSASDTFQATAKTDAIAGDSVGTTEAATPQVADLSRVRAASGGSSGQQTPRQGKKVLTWDEETIAEHDLERGTRQKIEEPNTPWMGSPAHSGRESAIHSTTPDQKAEDGGLHPVFIETPTLIEADLQERLQSWYKLEKHRTSIQERWVDLAGLTFPTVPSQPLDLSPEEKKAKDFAEKRKNHYKVDLKALRGSQESSEESDGSDGS